MDNLIIALVGSLFALDTSVMFQVLLAQPLITSTLIGWYFGDIQLGLHVGLYLQLLWLISLPVGGAKIPEGNVAAIVTTTLVMRHAPDFNHFNLVFVVGILYGLLISYIGAEFVVLHRRSNSIIFHRVYNQLQDGRSGVLGFTVFSAIMLHFILMSGLILAALSLADLLIPLLEQVPGTWDRFFNYGMAAVLGIGCGLIMTIFKEKGCKRMIALGTLTGIILFIVLR
jgi:mannose/fructose/N-acetylgalactosamine-specific phosphotransferase system component IIC